MDLASGFHQFKMNEGDLEETAFAVPWQTMPSDYAMHQLHLAT